MTPSGSTPGAGVVPTATALWVVTLDGTPPGVVDDLGRRWLDPDERSGAAAKHDPGDRRRVLASHLALRAVLGSWLGQHPADVLLARAACPLCGAAHGRPVLADPARRADRSFSLSRAAAIAAIALASGPEAIGVDIESLPPRVGADDLLAARHPDEVAALDALPRGQRDIAALRCWTRTEAVLKGWGTGLGVDPATVAVGLGTSPPPGQVRTSVVGTVDLSEHGLRRAGWGVADVGVAVPVVVAVALGSNEPGPTSASASTSAESALVHVAVHDVDLDELLARDHGAPVTGSYSD